MTGKREHVEPLPTVAPTSGFNRGTRQGDHRDMRRWCLWRVPVPAPSQKCWTAAARVFSPRRRPKGGQATPTPPAPGDPLRSGAGRNPFLPSECKDHTDRHSMIDEAEQGEERQIISGERKGGPMSTASERARPRISLPRSPRTSLSGRPGRPWLPVGGWTMQSSSRNPVPTSRVPCQSARPVPFKPNASRSPWRTRRRVGFGLEPLNVVGGESGEVSESGHRHTTPRPNYAPRGMSLFAWSRSLAIRPTSLWAMSPVRFGGA